MGSPALIVLAAALAVASGSWSPLLFGDMKIIGGTTVRIEDARFVVQVVKIEEVGNTTSFETCGGTLVSPNHVLTAGHCVGKNPASFLVAVGTSASALLFEDGALYRAKAVRTHPKYKIARDREDALFDVAVIRLEEKVTLGAKAGIISVTEANAEPKAGSDVVVAGWGVVQCNQTSCSRSSPKLKQAKFKVVNRAACKKGFGKLFTSQEFCINASLKSAFCSGDSGGPAYRDGVQYGVVSWGSCGQDKPSYDVLANLADPEINAFVRKMMKTL